jgi:uncharacterized protein (TIGR00251 family)
MKDFGVAVTRGDKGLTLAVRVTPRAGRTAIAGVRGNALAIRLAAAPIDGAANDALIALLAETFRRPRRDVMIVSGHTAREKRVAIAGLTGPEFEARLNDILSP